MLQAKPSMPILIAFAISVWYELTDVMEYVFPIMKWANTLLAPEAPATPVYVAEVDWDEVAVAVVEVLMVVDELELVLDPVHWELTLYPDTA